MPRLIYVADPMCSWCYGFGPELSALLDAVPAAGFGLVVGGLRAYNTKPMDDEMKATLRSHWQHVNEATGLPFSDAAMSHPGFVYDTEPACRAVVTARAAAEGISDRAALAVFRAIQHAFYALGQDVTRGDVLAQTAVAALEEAGVKIEAGDFERAWASDAMRQAAREDFMQTQRWGISGFPALILEQRDKLMLVASGFTPRAALQSRIVPLFESNPA